MGGGEYEEDQFSAQKKKKKNPTCRDRKCLLAFQFEFSLKIHISDSTFLYYSVNLIIALSHFTKVQYFIHSFICTLQVEFATNKYGSCIKEGSYLTDSTAEFKTTHNNNQ